MKKENKIYTRKGDKGLTSLIGGERVSKYHPRIEAYGTVDELNSYLGLIRDMLEGEHIARTLLHIQQVLFSLEARLAATTKEALDNLLPVTVNNVTFLEKEIDFMAKELPALKQFIIPGGNMIASHCHVARCVCRRAERTVLKLAGDAPVENVLIRYLNRLSDYLFTLARYITFQQSGTETLWEQ